MIKIIRERKKVEEHEYFIVYESLTEPGSGFEFPCNSHGEIDFESMHKSALENYEICESSPNYVYRGLQRFTNSYVEPRVGLCNCGEEVVLSSNTNYCCACGAMYNMMGQWLTSKKNWGEETGEHPADIEREMK
jgi:hypothetical protein